MTKAFLCKKCVLPSTFPNISFDEEGVCNFCNQYEGSHDKISAFKDSQKALFEKTVQELRGKFEYDALCCYSGGKDSTYLLKMMVEEFGLRTLAFTLDNGFIANKSRENINSVVEKIGVDHIFYKPAFDFMRKMYTESMLGGLNKNRKGYQTRISDACLSCITLINSTAARIALRFEIPMVFAGFTPGQIPKAVIKNSHHFYQQTFSENKQIIENVFGEESRYFEVPDSSFGIYQISPFLIFERSEDEILETIRELGWENPQDLDGCSTNCSLNAVGNMCHVKKFGFHPYAQELSQLVRAGLLSRSAALEKLEKDVGTKQIRETLERLGVDPSEFC